MPNFDFSKINPCKAYRLMYNNSIMEYKQTPIRNAVETPEVAGNKVQLQDLKFLLTLSTKALNNDGIVGMMGKSDKELIRLEAVADKLIEELEKSFDIAPPQC